MAFEVRTVSLVCPGCSAKHIAKWSRIPVREYQTVVCQACGGILYAGKSVLDYFEVKLIAD